MNHSNQELLEQVKQKVLWAANQGLSYFPPIPASAQAKSGTAHQELSYSLAQNMATCQRCPLSQTRKRVLVEPTFLQKRFFILSDFPELADEQNTSSSLYAESSSSGLLIKLMEKLNLLSQCHFSFALKCVPEKGVPQSALSQCALANLKQELEVISPSAILCFGNLSLRALEILSEEKFSKTTEENQEPIEFRLQKSNLQNPISIYPLSSSRDLNQFPMWRAQVWQALKGFAPNR